VLFTLSNSLLIPLDFDVVFSGKGASSGVAATGTLGGGVWNAIPDAARIAGRKGFINATLNQIEQNVQQEKAAMTVPSDRGFFRAPWRRPRRFHVSHLKSHLTFSLGAMPRKFKSLADALQALWQGQARKGHTYPGRETAGDRSSFAAAAGKMA
jgi:hypothetical protein